ncbi:hypothetical protein D3C87_1738450 [compost metagenome]
MNFQFYPVSAECLTRQPGGEYRFGSGFGTRGIGQQAYAQLLQRRQNGIIAAVQIDAFHRHGDQLRTGGLQGFQHQRWGGELAGAGKQA